MQYRKDLIRRFLKRIDSSYTTGPARPVRPLERDVSYPPENPKWDGRAGQARVTAGVNDALSIVEKLRTGEIRPDRYQSYAPDSTYGYPVYDVDPFGHLPNYGTPRDPQPRPPSVADIKAQQARDAEGRLHGLTEADLDTLGFRGGGGTLDGRLGALDRVIARMQARGIAPSGLVNLPDGLNALDRGPGRPQGDYFGRSAGQAPQLDRPAGIELPRPLREISGPDL